MESNHHKVIIVGSGPAGLTAAIYTARANLSPIVFEGIQPGGQLTITTEVENFPGYENGIMGPELMDVMRKQAHRFSAESIYKEITEVDFSKRPFVLKSDDEVYTADSVIISTGASARLLNIESEKKFCSEMGNCPREKVSKINFKKKDIEEKNMEVLLMATDKA